MNSDDTFWIALWKICGAFACVLTVTIGGCVANTHRVISHDLSAGISPLAVACAHSDGDARVQCALAALKP